jgi:hypothetical protein
MTMKTLAKQMEELAAFIQAALERNRAAADPHWQTCSDTADAFDLWQDERFPIWLSFIVAGQMRELGIEN